MNIHFFSETYPSKHITTVTLKTNQTNKNPNAIQTSHIPARRKFVSHHDVKFGITDTCSMTGKKKTEI